MQGVVNEAQPRPEAPRADGLDGRTRDLLLLGLTFSAGLVDAVSYLGLGNIFTANMTGNVVFLALAVGQWKLATALRSVGALIGFSVGATLAGRFLGRTKEPGPWPPKVTRILWAELLLLGAFGVVWAVVGGDPSQPIVYLLIGLSSVGMGMQNAAARSLAVPGLTTTVITTALTGLMAEFAAFGIAGPAHRRAAAAVAVLFGGAAVGAALMFVERPWPPAVTVAVLILVCVVAASRPWKRSAPSPG
jgi:uncharacterized membrane protein YoaK (UPF0700 family)